MSDTQTTESTMSNTKTESSNTTAASTTPTNLDIVFCVDCTGSMSQYIAAAQQNIQSIVEKIVAAEKCDLKFGLVAYRDHPPQESTYVTTVHPFTDRIKVMKEHVSTMSAHGGGDGPESVCCGMHDCLHMDWRKDATKIVVLIADAPPHGLGENGDGFPNGCPDGRDPLAIAKAMGEAGITLYTVGCEPSLGAYMYARDFMVAIADMTGGQAIALSSAQLLVDVIMGGAREELDLERLMATVEKKTEEARVQVATERATRGEKAVITEADGELAYDAYQKELETKVHFSMQSEGVRTKQMTRDGAIFAPSAPMMSKSSGLSDWRKKAPASIPYSGVQTATLVGACPPPGAPSVGGGGGMFGVMKAAMPWRRSSKDMSAASGAPSMCMDECESECMSMPPMPSSSSMMMSMPMSMPPAAGSASTHVTLTEDTISHDQVSRMMKKSAQRSVKG